MVNMSVKKDVKRVFSKNSEAYVSSSTHSDSKDLSLLTEWLNPAADMIALDIATGGGHAAKHFASYVKRVVATDMTKEMLENTSQHLTGYANIDYIIADAEQLPFLDNTFDIVVCRIAAHHFPHPRRFIQEVSRVLKEKGNFLLIDNVAPPNALYDSFINELEKIRDYSHVRSHNIEEWENLFYENNLEIKNQQKRRKILPYEEWINRTLRNEKKQRMVEKMMTDASEDVKQYFEITIENGKIQQFTIDEWMVLCTLCEDA
ncbi:class I SAM-dependent methyltransferase [Virgibacillus kimchii]